MKLAGLSIEGTRLRVAIVNYLPWKSTHASSMEMTISEAKEQREQDLRAALTRLRDTEGVHGVIVGVSVTLFAHHYIDLPLTKRQDIIHALSFELEKYLPLPPDEYVFDFVPISRHEERTRILVLATLKNRLSWIARSVKESGLILVGLRCGAVEMLNEYTTASSSERAVFAYNGFDATTVFGINDGVPEEMTVIRQPSEGPVDIKNITEKYGPAFFKAASPEAANTEMLPEAKQMDYSLPVLLGHSAYRKRKLDMFFTPGSPGRAVPLWQEYAPLALGAICVLLLVLTSTLGYMKDRMALSGIQQEIATLQEQANQLSAVKNELADIEARTKYLREFEERSKANIKAFRDVSVMLPVSAWLMNFSVDEAGAIQIDGYATRASDLIRPLENTETFRRAAFSSTVTVSQGRERFSISMELEP